MDERNEWWNGNEDGVFFRTERSVVVDYNIGTSRWTGIAEKGRRARSKENYGAGPTGLGLAILARLSGFVSTFRHDSPLRK